MAPKTRKSSTMKPVAVRLDPVLNETIREAIEDGETMGVFNYSCLSDFYRAAFAAYMKGMPLAKRDKRNRTERSNLRLTTVQLEKWNKLPPRKRSVVLELAARSYLSKHHKRHLEYARTKAQGQAEVTE